jgi:ribosomal protein S27E
MLIRINCPNPNCKKQLRIDARHAGKKVSCAGCNQHIRLPTAEELKINEKAAVTARASGGEEEIIDFDILASEAVNAEKTAAEEANKTEMVKFTCPQCDEPVEISAENAGKRAPCPACRRIIAVPKVEGAKPKDWREKQATGPSMAKKEEVKLEGAWGNQAAARVSVEALEEAKALPKEKRKLTVRDYVRYATTAIILLAVLGTGWWGWKRYRASSL